MIEAIDKLSTAASARCLALIWDVRKAKVDPEKLRAQLQSRYKKTFKAEARNAIAEAIQAVKGIKGPVEADEIALIMETLESKIGVKSLGTTLTSKSSTIVRDVFQLAAGEVKASYKLTVTDHRAIKVITDQDLLWIGKHVDNDLMPQFKEAVADVMQTGLSRRKLADRLAQDLGGIVDADAKYWSDLADHTITKSREIGRISGFEEAGIEQARVRAILDGKTSKICRQLNGRIIPVSKLSAQRDSILEAKTTDELEERQMWISEFKGQTDDLPSGVGIPPFHYKCRTKLFPIIQRQKHSGTLGDRVSDEDEKHIKRYSNEEHGLRVQDLKQQAKGRKLPYHESDLQGDLEKLAKHAMDEFGMSRDPKERKKVTERYMNVANDTIANADEVMVRIYRPRRKGSAPRMQYVFVSEKTGAETIVGPDGAIRNCNICRKVKSRMKGRPREMLWLKKKT